MQKAVKKLNDEMKKDKNSYVQAVGGFLLKHLEENPDSAENINVAEKTIAGSLNEMKKEASKQRVGGVAVLTDAEGFATVLKYFSIGKEIPAEVEESFDFLD